MKSVEIRNHSDVIVGNGVVLFVVLSPETTEFTCLALFTSVRQPLPLQGGNFFLLCQQPWGGTLELFLNALKR